MSEYLRRNVLGLIAVFIALGGTAAALPGKNTVDSGDIKKAQVKSSDLANGAVTNPKLAADAVDGSKVADNAIKGVDVDEASLDIPQQALPTSLPPSGAAGGDLSGTYPNPQVQESGLTAGGDVAGPLNQTAISDAAVDSADIENVERRILIPVTELSLGFSGGQEPDAVTLTGLVPALAFDPAVTERIEIATRIPDDRVPGTPVALDLHWSPGAAGVPPNAEVVFGTNFAGGGLNEVVDEDFEPADSPPTSGTVEGAHRISTVTVPAAADIEPGDLLFMDIFRPGTATSDDLPADANLHLIAIRYTAER